VTGPDVVVPPGQTRVLYPCFVHEESETVDAYRVSVNALCRVRDPRGNERWLVSSMPSQVSVALTVEGGLLKLLAERAVVKARGGATLSIPLRILRSPRLHEPATVRAVVPAALSHSVSADPIIVPAGQESATMQLRIATGSLAIGRHDLVLQALLTQPAILPRLATTLHATPLDSETLELLSRGMTPVISETTVQIELLAP
jgi:hypothetical protein